MKECKGVLVVRNKRGLHTRPSTELVKCATTFKSRIVLHHNTSKVSAKSLLGILMLAAEEGSRLEVSAEGEDAEEAIRAILALAEKKFYASY